MAEDNDLDRYSGSRPNSDESYHHPAHYHPEPDTPLDEEEEGGGPVKNFLDHLEDLRWVFIKSGACLLVGMIICMVAAPQIVEFLKRPIREAGLELKLETMNPVGGFMISLKVAFYTGVVGGLPFILFFIGQYILPALKKKEKAFVMRAFSVGTGFFIIGVVLCYLFLLPLSLQGLVKYNAWLGLPSEVWRSEEYFSFVTKFLAGVGLLFEIPVLILTLVKVGLVKHEVLVKGRRYMLIVNFVLCAVLTPADMVTTFLMAMVLQGMYELCILVSRHWDRQRKRDAALAGKLPE
jgi:sec-independent protein translocase protein TatC